MKKMKKEWKKPTITIIAKSTAEENVLMSCKWGVQLPGTSGPDTSICGYWEGPEGWVGPCYGDVYS